MGSKAVPGNVVCAGGNEWHPEHSGKHQPGTGVVVGHPAL